MNQPPADPLADARVQRLIAAAKRAIEMEREGRDLYYLVAYFNDEAKERLSKLKAAVEEIER